MCKGYYLLNFYIFKIELVCLFFVYFVGEDEFDLVSCFYNVNEIMVGMNVYISFFYKMGMGICVEKGDMGLGWEMRNKGVKMGDMV